MEHRLVHVWRWLALSCALLLTGCSGHAEPALRVGTNPWIGYLPLELAAERNLFRDPSVRIVDFASSAEVIRALENGNLEAACLTLDEALTAADRLSDLRVVMVLDYSRGSDGILALHPAATLRDISGSRVGVANTTTGAYLLNRALDHAGLSRDDVTLVPVASEDQRAMAASGRIDFLVTYEPMLSEIDRRGGHLVFSSADIPGEIIDVLLTREAVIRQQPAGLQALAEGWERAVAAISSGGENEALARLSGLGGNAAAHALSGLRFVGNHRARQLLDERDSSLRVDARNLNLVLFEKGFVDGPTLKSRLFDSTVLRRAAR